MKTTPSDTGDKMKIGNRYVSFVFNIHGIEFEFERGFDELMEDYLHEQIDDICQTRFIAYDTEDERCDRFKSFMAYKEEIAKQITEKTLSYPYKIEEWLESHKEWIEEHCLYLAEEEFFDWYFKCDFCGKYFSKHEEKADCDFYDLCESCYSDAQKNWG